MIDTIVIAAAGRGTRMKDLVTDRSKHMIPILGKPFLFYLLSSLQKAGFSKIILVIDYHADRIRAFLDECYPEVITVVQSEKVGKKYGTAAVLEAAQEYIGDDSFVYMNGDTVYTQKILSQIVHCDTPNTMMAIHHDHPEQYGVIEQDENGQLVRIVEKPKNPTSHLINAGLYIFTPQIFHLLPDVPLSERGEYEIVDAITMLMAETPVFVETISDGWIDLGKPEDIPLVETFIEKNHFVEKEIV